MAAQAEFYCTPTRESSYLVRLHFKLLVYLETPSHQFPKYWQVFFAEINSFCAFHLYFKVNAHFYCISSVMLWNLHFNWNAIECAHFEWNASGGSRISRRGGAHLVGGGVPTLDAATFRKICMSKWKNRVRPTGSANECVHFSIYAFHPNFNFSQLRLRLITKYNIVRIKRTINTQKISAN